jgi:photosystem II stability/assembly factor-like uncharacterized protein
VNRLVVGLALLVAASSAAWIPLGPDGGLVQALAIDPVRPETLYCVPYLPSGFLPVYRTTDAGQNWSRVGELADAGVAGIVIDPFSPSVLLGPSGSNLIQRSTDGGATWQYVSTAVYASAVACDPFVPGRIYAAGYFADTLTRPAVAISTDHGATWSDRLVKDDTGGIYAIDASAVDSGTIFLGGDYGSIYRSTDCGINWQQCSNGISYDDIVLTVSTSHGDAPVACAGTIYGMYRTTDAGESWTQVGTPRFVMSVDFSPADPTRAFAYGYDTAVACYYSTDAGVNWLPTSAVSPTARWGGLLADPGLGDGAWCPTQSGVVRTTDLGSSWLPRNSGIRTAVVSTINVPEWNRHHVYIEVQGVGVYKSPDAGQTWEKCADFLSCGNICGIGVAERTDADVLYALEGSG